MRAELASSNFAVVQTRAGLAQAAGASGGRRANARSTGTIFDRGILQRVCILPNTPIYWGVPIRRGKDWLQYFVDFLYGMGFERFRPLSLAPQ